MRIVIDCANGADYKAAPCILRELGAEVFAYGDKPDGSNINKECGSMHPDLISRKVWEHRAHIGIAHDGDADRVMLCDENGKLVDGDDIMAIAGMHMLEKGNLAKKTLVATVMSNAGLDQVIQKAGGKVIRTAVGDKNVIDEMLKKDYNFGGESSGHLIFRDYATTGDGLIAALQILSIMKEKDASLHQLTGKWQRFPQIITNIRVRSKPPFEELDGVLDLVKEAEKALQPQGGRVLLRYSGTEPKARLLLEGPVLSDLEKWNQPIADSLKQKIGATG